VGERKATEAEKRRQELQDLVRKRFDKEMADEWWSLDGRGFLNRYHGMVSISLETCNKSRSCQPCLCLHGQ
jgi:hypothetical protein